jgi:hypothetical protein
LFDNLASQEITIPGNQLPTNKALLCVKTKTESRRVNQVADTAIQGRSNFDRFEENPCCKTITISPLDT